MMKRWEDYSGLFEWAQYNHRGSCQRDRREEDRSQRYDNKSTETKRKIIKCYIAGFEDGAKECRWPPEDRKGNKMDFPLDLLEGI